MTDKDDNVTGSSQSEESSASMRPPAVDSLCDEQELDGDLVEWEDIEHGVPKFVHVWDACGGIAWMKEAWRRLEARGLTRYDGTGLGRTRVLIRLLSLAHLYWDFTYTAFDEGTRIGMEFHEALSQLDIAPLFVGQLLGPDAYAEDGYGRPDMAAACWELSYGERSDLVRALLDVFQGEALLFVSLWRSSECYDEDSPEIDDEELFGDVNVEKLKGYEWLTSGCPVMHGM